MKAETSQSHETHPHPCTGITGGRRFWIDANQLPKPNGHPPDKPDSGIGSAVCVGLPETIFLDANNLEQARQTCDSCPARRQCLEYALSTMRDGILAGLTLKQRGNIQKRRDRIDALRRSGNTEAVAKQERRLHQEYCILGLSV